jgi:hypothetical protein
MWYWLEATPVCYESRLNWSITIVIYILVGLFFDIGAGVDLVICSIILKPKL